MSVRPTEIRQVVPDESIEREDGPRYIQDLAQQIARAKADPEVFKADLREIEEAQRAMLEHLREWDFRP